MCAFPGSIAEMVEKLVRADVAQRVTFLQHAGDIAHERSWLMIHGDFGRILLCVWYRPPCTGEIWSIHGFIDE